MSICYTCPKSKTKTKRILCTCMQVGHESMGAKSKTGQSITNTSHTNVFKIKVA